MTGVQTCALPIWYYPSFGTPHDNLWTRQTKAHNGVLVNGRGQPPFTWEAGGRIESYERHGTVTLARGQAAGAYNLPQPAGIATAWLKLLKEPLPAMEPAVQDYQRTLAFVASPSRPFLIVHDYVKTAAPATFEWLLHALNQMETDGRTGSVFVRDGDARMAVRLISTVPYTFKQHNKFPIPPESANNTAYVLGTPHFPDQWHLSAATSAPVAEMKFLAVLVPYRASEAPPAIDLTIQTREAAGFRVGETEVSAWWGPGAQGALRPGDLTGEGRMLLKVRENGKESTVVAQ